MFSGGTIKTSESGVHSVTGIASTAVTAHRLVSLIGLLRCHSRRAPATGLCFPFGAASSRLAYDIDKVNRKFVTIGASQEPDEITDLAESVHSGTETMRKTSDLSGGRKNSGLFRDEATTRWGYLSFNGGPNVLEVSAP
jgi:hypothetical protein